VCVCVCVGFLPAAVGCCSTSMCCLHAWSTSALRQVQCASSAAAKAQLPSWRRRQYVRPSDVAPAADVADVAVCVATDLFAAEAAFRDEPTSHACQSRSELASILCFCPF